ncbi:phosphotransferase enzyme family protein [Zalerion maritima]|uniref:Phosphotransferase enzyme family protein n=1 Tax=Zalerion maritima TaxID=339359 RepID=A0AAD5RTR0_9PEZI|nr:phosphotransferase enzyme family protein [Zalerion maritima]
MWQTIENEWLDPALNKGPFVLSHGDLGPQNILVDKDFNIAGILDWEWSSVVPVQCLTPIEWIDNGSYLSYLPADTLRGYHRHVERFTQLVEKQEVARYGEGNTLLADLWKERSTKTHMIFLPVFCSTKGPIGQWGELSIREDAWQKCLAEDAKMVTQDRSHEHPLTKNHTFDITKVDSCGWCEFEFGYRIKSLGKDVRDSFWGKGQESEEYLKKRLQFLNSGPKTFRGQKHAIQLAQIIDFPFEGDPAMNPDK